MDREGDRVLAARAELIDRREAHQCFAAPRHGLRETPHAYEHVRDEELGVGTYLEIPAPERGLEGSVGMRQRRIVLASQYLEDRAQLLALFEGPQVAHLLRERARARGGGRRRIPFGE